MFTGVSTRFGQRLFKACTLTLLKKKLMSAHVANDSGFFKIKKVYRSNVK